MKKKTVFLAWMATFFLAFGISGILSFLFFLGPIISGVIMVKLSDEWPLFTKKPLIAKSIFSFSGLIATLLIQALLLKFSKINILLNALCFLGAFAIGWWFISVREKKKIAS